MPCLEDMIPQFLLLLVCPGLPSWLWVVELDRRRRQVPSASEVIANAKRSSASSVAKPEPAPLRQRLVRLAQAIREQV